MRSKTPKLTASSVWSFHRIKSGSWLVPRVAMFWSAVGPTSLVNSERGVYNLLGADIWLMYGGLLLYRLRIRFVGLYFLERLSIL